MVSGLPRWHSGKESTCQCRRYGFHLWVRKIPWSRKWQPTSVFLLRKFPGQRRLVGSTTTLPHGPGPGKRSSDPWRRLRAFSLVPVAPPATSGRVGGPAQHPLPAPINPSRTVSGLGPALSPSRVASPPSPGCWGEGRKFSGSEASRALPQSSRPPPLRAAPRGSLTR